MAIHEVLVLGDWGLPLFLNEGIDELPGVGM